MNKTERIAAWSSSSSATNGSSASSSLGLHVIHMKWLIRNTCKIALWGQLALRTGGVSEKVSKVRVLGLEEREKFW